MGRLDEEIQSLTRALELGPLSADLRLRRAGALARQARNLAESGTPDARERAARALGTAESDLSGIRKHALLESVQTAIKEAQAALKSGF